MFSLVQRSDIGVRANFHQIFPIFFNFRKFLSTLSILFYKLIVYNRILRIWMFGVFVFLCLSFREKSIYISHSVFIHKNSNAKMLGYNKIKIYIP